MSLTPVTLTNATDTWIQQSRPSENNSTGTRLRVRAGSDQLLSYIQFSRPVPLGATVTSATLTLTQYGTTTGSRTVTIRRILSKWVVGTVTYGSKKAVDTTTSAPPVTKGAATTGTTWTFDVTALVQAVANGAPWYGWQIETTDTTQHFFYSAQGSQGKPVLNVTWTDAPQAPSTLAPSGGDAISVTRPIFDFDFTDHMGSTTQNAVRVQTNLSNVWTTPQFDSGVILTNVSQLDTNSGTTRLTYVNTTSGSTTVVAPNSGSFASTDVGGTITGTGIPAGATITAFTNSFTVTISAAATATATNTQVTINRGYIGAATGVTTYWRVQVQDTAGVWSDWSDAAQFTRVADGVLTIINPASATPVVTEPTPPILWTFTGQTQSAFQVLILGTKGKTLHDSGRIVSTQTSYTLPEGIIHDATNYTVYVRVWDTVSRATIPNDLPYVEASRDFTFSLSSTVAPVTGLTGTDLSPVPAMRLNWSRSIAPDSFAVFRGNSDGTNMRQIKTGLLPQDVLVSGTSYQWTDYGADPRVAQRWEVRAVVTSGGVTNTSASNPNVVKTLTPVGIWLLDPDTGVQVQLLGSDSGSWSMGEDAEVYTPVGGTKVVRITQALRGFEGSVSGILVATNGTTVSSAQANMYALKANAGSTYWLTLADMCIPVVIGNVVIAPTPDAEITKQVSFDFWQVGDLPFTASL